MANPLDPVEPNQVGKLDDLPTAAPGTPGGLAGPLDGSGMLPTSQLPQTAITDTFVVANQAARLALSAQVGDVAIQSDVNLAYILQALPASTNGNWVQLPVQPYTTSTHGGAGNAGKLLALDAGGLADGQDLLTLGQVVAARTAANTVSTIVARDSSGNFSAGTITASLTGTASGNDVLGAAAAVQTNLTSHISDSTDAHAATAIGYTPTTSGDWSPAPIAAGPGLDQLASRVKTLETTPSGVSSFNGRTGPVTPADGDYSQNLITGLKTSSSPTFVAITSSASTGTAPLTISSTTKVSNLNADLLDGYNSSTTAAATVIPVSGANNTIPRGFVATGAGASGNVPIQQPDGSLQMGPQTVSTSGGLSGGTGIIVYEVAGAPVTLANNESALIVMGEMTDPRVQVNIWEQGTARTNQTNTWTFSNSTESSYVQESASLGTDFVSGGVYLHRTLSDSRIKLLLQGNGTNGGVPFEPFFHALGGSGFAVSTTSPKYGSGCINIDPATGIRIDTTGDVPSGWGSYSWTIQAWVRWDVLGGFRGVFCSNSATFDVSSPTAWLLATDSTNLNFYASSSTGSWTYSSSTVTTVSTGTWYQLAVDYDATTSTMHVYVNGTSMLTVSGVTSLYSGHKYLSLGFWHASPFDGQMDDIRLTVDSPSNPPIYNGVSYTSPSEFTDPSYTTTGYWVYSGETLELATARIATFDSATFVEQAMTGTQLRYLVSWNGGTTWVNHSGTTVALADIHTTGSTSTQMGTYFTSLSTPVGATSLSWAVGLKVTDTTLSPRVSSISVQYDEPAPWVPGAAASYQIRVWLGSAGVVEVKNVSGGSKTLYAYAEQI